MDNFLDKLSSYNLFNYLFPGILFVVIASEISSINFIQENIFIGVFVYYFIGLIISRIGSLIIEPLLKTLSFVTFSEYKDYISASSKDKNIELLSEVNNMYRTISAMFLLVLCIPPLEGFYIMYPEAITIVMVIALIILFLCSYKKQTKYITQRVDANKD